MKKYISIILIVLIGFLIRAVGINWDQGTFLHPDERFLVMVVQSLDLPENIQEYFSTDSPLQVRNTEHSFYVYGSFPVVFIRLLREIFLENDSFESITFLGRWITIILETLNIILVISFAKFLTQKYKLNKKTPLWSGLLYAISVLPIQLSHFFTVDPFVTFFCLLAINLSTKLNKKFSLFWLLTSSFFFGLAVSSKATAAFFAPIIGLLIISLISNKEKKIFIIAKKILIFGIIFSLGTYLSIRVFNPEYFANSSFLNFEISKQFILNLKTLEKWSNPNTVFPPAMQWLNKTPILFSLKNIFFFGLGIWKSIFALIGIYFALSKKRKTFISFIIIWLLAIIFWQGTQFVQSLRYYYFLYPFFSIFSAMGITYIQKLKILNRKPFITTISILILVLIWPLMFLQIFLQDHSRVSATYWMRQNIPLNKKLLYEYWDDALPLAYAPGTHVHFETDHVSIFDQDTDRKWEKINQQLAGADYYVISSNRGWGSIGNLPNKYPITSKFYADLFNNQTQYKLEKAFVSKPSLKWLGIDISLDDQWAEEAFTVYDHPQVYIFRKN